MSDPIRVPLATNIGSRDGFFESADPFIRNGYVETFNDKKYIRKRPGIAQSLSAAPGGNDQQLFYFNGFFYAVVSDILYAVSIAGNAGTTGAAFTAATTPPWSTVQAGFVMLVYKDRMWLVGATSAIGSTYGNVWSTTDGNKWVQNSASAFPTRFAPTGCVFQNQMFVMGGAAVTPGLYYNDVYSSSDGSTWTRVNPAAPWSGRSDAECVAANNGIFFMGGNAGAGALNDVWFSSDGGITWNLVVANANWPARTDFGLVYFNNLLFVIGGFGIAANALNDVWSSPDGIVWTQVTAAAFASPRGNSSTFVFEGKIWNLGGATAGLVANKDVYNSSDGAFWTLVTNNPGWGARYDFGAIPFRTPLSVSPYRYPTIWVVGGIGFIPPDVWRANLDTAITNTYPLPTSSPGQPIYSIETYMNGTKLLVKNNTDMWVLESGTLTKVVDANFPTNTVPGIVVLNAFAHVLTPLGEVHTCTLDDPLTWPSLQYLTADYEDDPAVCLAKYLNYVCVLGQYTTQFFYDNGANQPEGTPLAPYLNANLRVGCFSALSVVQMFNTLVWVAQDENGRVSVVMLNALVPQTISTPFVERILNKAIGFSALLNATPLAIEGYEFYLVNIGGACLVYDFAAKLWYFWDVNFDYTASQFANNARFAMALSNGNILQVSNALLNDNGTPFPFVAQTMPIEGGNRNNKFFGRLTLVGDKSPATPLVQWTDDDYQTFNTGVTVNMALPRPDLTRLGAAKRRAFKITQTDSNPGRWEALELTVSQGEA
jgi:hypothetical protein